MAAMSSKSQAISGRAIDLGDAFCSVFDQQAEQPLGDLDWMQGAKAKAAINGIKRKALSGVFSLDSAPSGWTGQEWDLIQLKGLDEFFGEVGGPGLVSARSRQASSNPELALAERLAERYEGTGRLNEAAPGALLPKRAHGLRTGAVPDRLQDAFSSVVRVPAEVWSQIDFVPLSAGHEDLSRRHLLDGLRIACVAFLESDEDIILEQRTRGGVDVFSVRPRDGERLRGRVQRVLAALDRSGAHIGVLPESAASVDLLEAWRQAIKSPTRLPSSLRWVLIGSGNFKEGLPPDNTAVLLDARTGETIATQSKCKHFVMTAEDVERWGYPRGHSGPIEEDLAVGHRLTVIESRIGRVCILVCEDLAAAVRLGSLLDAVGASLILAPVFSRPLKEHRWEQQGANVLLNSVGPTVVVVNSLVIGRHQGETGQLGAAMIVGSEETTIRYADGPEDLMQFHIDPPRADRRYVAAA